MGADSKKARFYTDPLFLLLYGPLVTTAPMIVQIVVMTLDSPDFRLYDLKSGLFFLCMPSVIYGLALGAICLGLWKVKASRPRSGGAHVRAFLVGVVTGALGAYPVGWLESSTTLATNLNFDESQSIPAFGAYLTLMFVGYMLWWELCVTPNLAGGTGNQNSALGETDELR